MTNWRTLSLALLGALLLLGLAVYYESLDRGFVYDDILVIRDNDFIAQPQNLLRLHGTAYLAAAGEQTYRPLVTATYIVDYWLWGREPFGYGLTNLLLHVGAAWLLALLVGRALPTRRTVAALAACLYLVHPALVETVISPGNREQILSVGLALLGAWAWHRARTDGPRTLRVLSLLSLALACLTLEWAVLVPALLTAWAWVEMGEWRKSLRAAAAEWAVALVYLTAWLFWLPRTPTTVTWLGGGPLGGLWAFGVLFWRYVRLACLPMALRPSYTFTQPSVWISALALACLLAVAVIAFVGLRKRQWWAVGVATFLVGLLPVSHVFMPFWIPMAERYLALPLVGWLPVVAALLCAGRRTWCLVLSGLLLTGWSLTTHGYAQLWRNGHSLWEYAVALEPGDPIGWSNYGAGLSAAGRPAEAVAAHRRAWDAARAIGHDQPKYPLQVAEALDAAGRNPEACALLVEQTPRYTVGRHWRLTMGRLCLGTDHTQAAATFGLLVTEDPNDCDAWAGFCATDTLRAPDCLRTAIRHCPRDGRLWLQVAGQQAARGDRIKAAQAVAAALATPHGPLVRRAALGLLRPAAAKGREAR